MADAIPPHARPAAVARAPTRRTPAQSAAARAPMIVDIGHVIVVIGVTLVLPVVSISVVGGAPTRAVFPAYSLVIGLLLLRRDLAQYVIFAIAMFVFSPFLRRVADYQAGFVDFNPILLSPYVALLPAIPALIRAAMRGGRWWPFAAASVCIVYAEFVCAFDDRALTTLNEPLRWTMPMALCALIAERPASYGLVYGRLVVLLAIVIPLTTAYGIVQYFSPPLWDVVWMMNVQNPTFGLPQAYLIRVFSMMNSPGSTATFTTLGMVLLLSEGWVAVLAAITGLPLVALTIVRAGWVALGVGIVGLLVLARVPRKLAIVAGLCLPLVVLAGNQVLPVEIQNTLQDRIDSFTNLSTDTSAGDRLATYGTFVDRMAASPMGEGFGVTASPFAAAAHRDLIPLDSGILELFLTFGIPAGALYVFAIGCLIATGVRGTRAARSGLAGPYATILATIAILPLGAYNLGELGILPWCSLGILLAAGQAASAST